MQGQSRSENGVAIDVSCSFQGRLVIPRQEENGSWLRRVLSEVEGVDVSHDGSFYEKPTGGQDGTPNGALHRLNLGDGRVAEVAHDYK